MEVSELMLDLKQKISLQLIQVCQVRQVILMSLRDPEDRKYIEKADIRNLNIEHTITFSRCKDRINAKEKHKQMVRFVKLTNSNKFMTKTKKSNCKKDRFIDPNIRQRLNTTFDKQMQFILSRCGPAWQVLCIKQSTLILLRRSFGVVILNGS